MSLVEAVARVAVGYGVAVGTQIVVFPWFGLHASLADDLTMGAIFTGYRSRGRTAFRRVFSAA